MTTGAVRTWLRLEGLAAFVAGLVLYTLTDSGLALPRPAAPPARRLGDRLPGRPAGRRRSPTTSSTTGCPGFVALGHRPVAGLDRGQLCRGDPHRPRRAWIAPSATASSCRARSTTPTSGGWGARRRESRPGTDIHAEIVAAGRALLEAGGLDAVTMQCGRRAGRRSGAIALQAVPEPRRADRGRSAGDALATSAAIGAAGRAPIAAAGLRAIAAAFRERSPTDTPDVRAAVHEPAAGLAAASRTNARAAAPLLDAGRATRRSRAAPWRLPASSRRSRMASSRWSSPVRSDSVATSTRPIATASTCWSRPSRRGRPGSRHRATDPAGPVATDASSGDFRPPTAPTPSRATERRVATCRAHSAASRPTPRAAPTRPNTERQPDQKYSPACQWRCRDVAGPSIVAKNDRQCDPAEVGSESGAPYDVRRLDDPSVVELWLSVAHPTRRCPITWSTRQRVRLRPGGSAPVGRRDRARTQRVAPDRRAERGGVIERPEDPVEHTGASAVDRERHLARTAADEVVRWPRATPTAIRRPSRSHRRRGLVRAGARRRPGLAQLQLRMAAVEVCGERGHEAAPVGPVATTTEDVSSRCAGAIAS